MPADPKLLDAVLEKVAPDPLRERLRRTLTRNDYEGVISLQEVKEFASENDLTIDQTLLILATAASVFARPAISNYSVGAIAQGSVGGPFYMGANMEFTQAALSFTLHAEQAATVNAWSNGEKGLLLLAVNAAPCGYCRQFLYELTTASDLTVLLEKKKKPSRQPLTFFLPEAFGPEDLNWEGKEPEALMEPQTHDLELIDGSPDPVASKALEAAGHSYAPWPYTRKNPCFAGVAVETESGATFSGRLAENAAFNPSLSPLEAALSMWNFSAARQEPLKRVVLVQMEDAIADQLTATEAVAAALPGHPLVEQHLARLSSS